MLGMRDVQTWSAVVVPHGVQTDASNNRQSKFAIQCCWQQFLTLLKQLANLSMAAPEGRYSLSKLAAFERFRQKATLLRVFALLTFAPVPSILLVLALECIPLADPDLGWQHSMAFQLRLAIISTVMAVLSIYERREHISETAINWKLAVGFGVGVMLSFAATNFTIMAAADIFPVPLTMMILGIPTSITARLMMHFFNKSTVLSPQTDINEYNRRLKTVDNLQIAQTLPLVFYPIYAAAFSQLDATMQPYFSLLLIALRLGVRFMQWRVAREDTDLSNVILGASGHLVHVLFMLTCLQNAKSENTLKIVVTYNTVQMMYNCRTLIQGSSSGNISRHLSIHKAVQLLESDDIIKELDRADRTLVLSTSHQYLDTRLQSLHDRCLQQEAQVVQSTYSKIRCRCFQRHRETSPTPIHIPISMRGSLNCDQHCATNSQHLKPVTEICAALHESEAILLRTYITTALVGMYGAYLLVVFWLPNRQFILTMQTMTTFTSVHETLLRHSVIYCTEVVFGCVYLVLIYRRFGVVGTTQLAFVLTSQFTFFQVKFISYPIYIFVFPVVHSGNEAILTF